MMTPVPYSRAKGNRHKDNRDFRAELIELMDIEVEW